MELLDILFAIGNVLKNCWDVKDDLQESHKGHILVMLGQIAPGLLHQITAPTTDFCGVILFFECLDQIGPVQVARCFASDGVIFHG